MRPVAAQVADRADLSVGDGDQRSACIAQHGAAQRQMLDAPGGVPDLYRIANDVLVLEDDVKARDQVADQILRAKSDSHAGQAGKRQGRERIDADSRQRRENSNNPNHLASGAVKHAGQRARLLLADLRRARLGRRHLNH